MNGLDWVVPLLRCPVCSAGLRFTAADAVGDQGILRHPGGGCDEVYPVIDGIPRVLVGASRAVLVRDHASWFRGPARVHLRERWSGRGSADRIVRGFDAEWTRFDDARSAELRAVFNLYFDVVPASLFSQGHVVLDAGCGAGRWAVEVAARGPRVLALDLGRSVEIARRNAGRDDRVACVQADLLAIPLREGAVDWAYSLGVLHHLEEPRKALAGITGSVRSGGSVLLYLYYALDGRSPAYQAAFRVEDVVRGVTSRLPHPILLALSEVLAVLVYLPLARLSGMLARRGLTAVAEALPLSFYRDRSLRVMRNDSLDRFGTAVEHRYTRTAMEHLMRSAGLTRVRFSERAPFWHAVGDRE